MKKYKSLDNLLKSSYIIGMLYFIALIGISIVGCNDTPPLQKSTESIPAPPPPVKVETQYVTVLIRFTDNTTDTIITNSEDLRIYIETNGIPTLISAKHGPQNGCTIAADVKSFKILHSETKITYEQQTQ